MAWAWTLNKVYNGDMVVLQGQEKVFLTIKERWCQPIYKANFHLYISLVLAFRNWLLRHGNSQPSGSAPAATAIHHLSKRQVRIRSTLPNNPSSCAFSFSAKPTLQFSQMLDRFKPHTLKVLLVQERTQHLREMAEEDRCMRSLRSYSRHPSQLAAACHYQSCGDSSHGSSLCSPWAA